MIVVSVVPDIDVSEPDVGEGFTSYSAQSFPYRVSNIAFAPMSYSPTAKLGSRMLSSIVLSAETGSFAGGLILRRGSVEANCTAELLVELCRGEMSSEIAKLLFD